jgi:predicted peroxiredoxin
MMAKNTSKQIRNLLESALEDMASRGSTYTLANVNNAVESSSASTQHKNEVKDIVAEAFEAGIKCFVCSHPNETSPRKAHLYV